jgi:hypothetical protein
MKRATTTTPTPAQHCMGERGAVPPAALKICLMKTFNYTLIISKSSLKMKFFLWKTPETKKFAEIFAKHF